MFLILWSFRSLTISTLLKWRAWKCLFKTERKNGRKSVFRKFHFELFPNYCPDPVCDFTARQFCTGTFRLFKAVAWNFLPPGTKWTSCTAVFLHLSILLPTRKIRMLLVIISMTHHVMGIYKSFEFKFPAKHTFKSFAWNECLIWEVSVVSTSVHYLHWIGHLVQIFSINCASACKVIHSPGMWLRRLHWIFNLFIACCKEIFM